MKKPVNPSYTIGTSYGKGKTMTALPAIPQMTKKEQFRADVASGKYDKTSVNLKTGAQLSKVKTATAISNAEGVSKRQRRIAAQEHLGVNRSEYKRMTTNKVDKSKSKKVGQPGCGVNLCRSPKKF